MAFGASEENIRDDSAAIIPRNIYEVRAAAHERKKIVALASVQEKKIFATIALQSVVTIDVRNRGVARRLRFLS